MAVSCLSGLLLFVGLWCFSNVQPETTLPPDSGELALIEEIENRRLEAIKFLNNTEAYEMATAISANVADIMKFFDDLGTLFRNGTLATYTCMVEIDGTERCDIYALPNGSMPLRKSVVKLMFDVFNMTRRNYGGLGFEIQTVELVRTWFSSQSGLLATERRDAFSGLLDAFDKEIIDKIWWGYAKLLISRWGLENLDKSTWQNNTGRNITTQFRIDGTCSNLFQIEHDEITSRSEAALYALMGPQCAKESQALWKIQGTIIEIASTGTLNGGDSNRCFPVFLIRCNNYDEAGYKRFVKDISTLIYHELTMVSLCLGMSPKSAGERGQFRARLSEQVRAVMKRMLEVRSVLKEVAPSQAVEKEVTKAVANVSTKLTTLLSKNRLAIYDSVIRNVVQKLKLAYNSNDNGSVDGVMYLPYEMDNKGMHCFHANASGGNYSGSVGEEVNYFVKYRWTAATVQTLKEKFAKLQRSKDRIVRDVFAESHEDLCERVLVAIHARSHGGWYIVPDVMDGTGFSAFLAVKCSYDFVWYELGWRYYTAARTTSDYVLEANGATFNANCGQVIFLP